MDSEGRKELKCQYCSKKIYFGNKNLRCKSCANRLRKGKFHSNNKMKLGELNPAWKGGISRKYSHRITFEILPNKCMTCNSTNNLCTHHCDGNPKNNKISNLSLVCRSCHECIHLRRRKYDLARMVR